MKNIGITLKLLRERTGLTRREVAEKLIPLGFDISDKTIYGYESGRNSANADMFLALCKIYNCTDILHEFEDVTNDILFTNEEWKFIEKYRALNQHGKEMIDTVLQKEYENSISAASSSGAGQNTLLAAHPNEDRTHSQEEIDNDLELINNADSWK